MKKVKDMKLQAWICNCDDSMFYKRGQVVFFEESDELCSPEDWIRAAWLDKPRRAGKGG